MLYLVCRCSKGHLSRVFKPPHLQFLWAYLIHYFYVDLNNLKMRI